MRKYVLLSFLVALAMLAVPMVSLADSVTTNVNITVNNPAVQQVGLVGTINWEQGIIEAKGTGIPPLNARTAQQAQALARRAAMVDAYRQLAEIVNGVKIDSETTVKDMEIASDEIRTKVSALIQGAVPVREMPHPDGSYEVVMQLRLFGQSSVMGAIAGAAPTGEPKPFPEPTPGFSPPSSAVVYTGVVIDATGMTPAFLAAPRIHDTNGRAIYGNEFVDYDVANGRGLVDYVASPEELAKIDMGQSRAGSNPLFVKCLGLRDGVENNENFVISVEDADKILAANAQSGFLKRWAVVVKLQ